MKITNLCTWMHEEDKTAFEIYAKRLGADKLVIQSDGTISLYCKDGCICEYYEPAPCEMYEYVRINKLRRAFE